MGFSLQNKSGPLCSFFQQMYTVVDTAVVGRVLGVDALAALGTVDWLNWLTLGTIQGKRWKWDFPYRISPARYAHGGAQVGGKKFFVK